MTTASRPTSTPAERDLVITRVFDAPRDLVWKAWTEPERFKKWWGPKDFTAPVCQIDFRPGGRYLWCMHGPQGEDYWTTGVFREIVPISRLVYTDAFADAQGNVVPASEYDLPGDWPAETLVTVTLEDEGSGTRMTLRHAGIPFGTMSEMTGSGWTQSFDKLAASLGYGLTLELPSDREILMTRVFDASRRLVFEAHSKPEHVKRWFGSRRFTMTVCEMDFRTGGSWRFVQRGPDGQEHGFRGEYREVVPPERIVQTFQYDGLPGQVSVETLTFVERDGKTTLSARSVFETVADRDGMLRSGMEAGARETWQRLADCVKTM